MTTGRRRLAVGVLSLLLAAALAPVAVLVPVATVGSSPAQAASACAPRPAWVDGSPAATSTPAPGITASVWHGTGHTGIPLTVAAVEADTGRYAFSNATPARLGQVVPSTALIERSNAPAGMNGDYYVRAEAGTLPKGVVVRNGIVLYAPTGDRRTVGSDDQGRMTAGLARVDGTFATFNHQVKIGAVNAVGPRAAAVTAFNTFGARQPHQAAWYVLVRKNLVVSSSATHPKLRDGDVLLASKKRSTLSVFTKGEPATVNVGVRSLDTGRLLKDAVGTGNVILRGGKVVADCTSSFGTSRRPRSVVAWDNSRSKVWLITMNARDQVGIRGGRYGEIAAVAQYLGADGAVLVDGGHSTTLTVRQGGGHTRIDAAPGSAIRSVPNGIVLRPRFG